MNNVNIIGRAGRDPELHYTPSGKAVAELNLAVDDGWGENRKTAWICVTIWGATAELAVKAIREGDRVGITGRLSQDKWEDKVTGKKQRKTKVTCENMTLLGDRREGDGERQKPAPAAKQPPERQRHEQAKANAAQPEPEEDDIPF